MSEVVSIIERKPHLSGEAKCMHCEHRWMAVSPIGITQFECPECGLLKGVFYAYAVHEKYAIWRCSCGNDLYFLHAGGCLCSLCGAPQYGF